MPANGKGKIWAWGTWGCGCRFCRDSRSGSVVWRGDAEFPAEGKVLFDSSVSRYLPVEDIVVLAETVVWKLIKKKGHSPQRAQSTQRKEI